MTSWSTVPRTETTTASELIWHWTTACLARGCFSGNSCKRNVVDHYLKLEKSCPPRTSQIKLLDNKLLGFCLHEICTLKGSCHDRIASQHPCPALHNNQPVRFEKTWRHLVVTCWQVSQANLMARRQTNLRPQSWNNHALDPSKVGVGGKPESLHHDDDKQQQLEGYHQLNSEHDPLAMMSSHRSLTVSLKSQVWNKSLGQHQV